MRQDLMESGGIPSVIEEYRDPLRVDTRPLILPCRGKRVSPGSPCLYTTGNDSFLDHVRVVLSVMKCIMEFLIHHWSLSAISIDKQHAYIFEEVRAAQLASSPFRCKRSEGEIERFLLQPFKKCKRLYAGLLSKNYLPVGYFQVLGVRGPSFFSPVGEIDARSPTASPSGGILGTSSPRSRPLS